MITVVTWDNNEDREDEQTVMTVLLWRRRYERVGMTKHRDHTQARVCSQRLSSPTEGGYSYHHWDTEKTFLGKVVHPFICTPIRLYTRWSPHPLPLLESCVRQCVSIDLLTELEYPEEPQRLDRTSIFGRKEKKTSPKKRKESLVEQEKSLFSFSTNPLALSNIYPQ